MDFSSLCRFPILQDESCNLPVNHGGMHVHTNGFTDLVTELFLCNGTVERSKREEPCLLPMGHRGAHTLQVEHRKHWHDNGAVTSWCLTAFVNCPDDVLKGGASKPWYERGEAFPSRQLDAPTDYPKNEPVLFSMYRGTDESGISGEGKVLDGVIFTDGLVVVRWVTVNASQSTVMYDCSAKEGEKPTTGFQKFLDIHVRAHPANNTVIEFRVGEKAKYVWTQPQGTFDIDQKRAEEAARYIMWAVQQPWFVWPKAKQGVTWDTPKFTAKFRPEKGNY